VVETVVVITAQTVELAGDLGRWSGQRAARPEDHDLVAVGVQRPWRVRAEQVGVPSGISPVREDDPEVATRTLVIAVGWSLWWRSRAGG
jgi:hypothetical protein